MERDREIQSKRKSDAEQIISDADRELSQIDALEARFKNLLSSKNEANAPVQKRRVTNTRAKPRGNKKLPYGGIKGAVLEALYESYPDKLSPLEVAAKADLPSLKVRPALKEGKGHGLIEHDRTNGNPLYRLTAEGAKFLGKELPQMSLVKQGDTVAA